MAPRRAICPACGCPLDKVRLSAEESHYGCGKCGGWFDSRELRRKNAAKTEGGKIMPVDYICVVNKNHVQSCGALPYAVPQCCGKPMVLAQGAQPAKQEAPQRPAREQRKKL